MSILSAIKYKGKIIYGVDDDTYYDIIEKTEDPRSGGEERELFLRNKYDDLCSRLTECLALNQIF